ncbi:protein adenylyltransferase SelO [Roseospira navarrensis]|uniref:Protein nucleotidyltransferase YdiU n=1 Tax=Roseospira navarrensis TaxID=140058 RepID=A0A7X2D301_9PROT|nr:YdiU family protein [Roseospira navarrensis]MQX36276.1 YdiU family protein [Roseospira navarrensis]
MTALTWRFDNSYARLPDAFYTRLGPTPVRAPRLVIFNHGLAATLGLAPADATPDADTLAALFAGNALPEGATPLAQAYAGHQFGHFTMLGDGRAIVLGEHLAPDGRRVDIQFKGSGRTPYSRMGDGRAALGPMLREYVISEALHALGIPSTRSLAVVATGEPVYREDALPGAVLTRVAASHLRVGTVQYAAARRDTAGLAALVRYAIERHDPDLSEASPDAQALALLGRVAARQADLVVDWMRVGFVHGVMNTDNMTLSGESIDYGPCAFMDAYDPATAFSSIDHGRRYAFGNQPAVAQWNLARLAEALLPLIHTDADQAVTRAEEAIGAFRDLYETRWTAMMRRKLGLPDAAPEDGSLIDDLLAWMQETGADYTNTFRTLTNAGTLPGAAGSHPDDRARAWLDRWRARRGEADAATVAAMRRANPAYIPRNHIVEDALAAATQRDDLAPLHALLAVLAAPHEPRPGLEAYTAPDPAGPGRYRTFCGT